MEHNTIKGAILDFDGTLLDSMNVWHDIDKELLKRYNITASPREVSEKVKKMTIEESSEYFIKEFSLPLTANEFAALVEEMAEDQYANKLRLKDGADEFLLGLDRLGIDYGIATATYPKLARAALDRLGLTSRIKFLLTESELETCKSEPYIYYEAAKLLGLGKRQVLVAEDSVHGILTAKKAGFFTAGVYDKTMSKDEWQQICANATISVMNIEDILSHI